MSTKRKAPTKTKKKVTKPFRPPRRASAPVIPGLLMQTGTEKKVLCTNNTFAASTLALNTTGTILPLNLIQVGSSMFNRIGRRIEMRSVRFTARLDVLAVTRDADTDYARIAIVYDRQTNAAIPAITAVFQDTTQDGTNSTNAMSGVNMNNRERFVVIMDKRFGLPNTTNTAGVLTNTYPNGDSQHIVIDEFRKMRGLTTHYGADSNPAVIGDITTGALYIITLTSVHAAGAEQFALNPWNVRLKYIDV